MTPIPPDDPPDDKSIKVPWSTINDPFLNYFIQSILTPRDLEDDEPGDEDE